MDLNIDPNTSLAELQTQLFMAAITELIQLARTTDQDHIKLRALTEVARLCNPAKRDATSSAKPLPSPRRGESCGERPHPDPSPTAAPQSNLEHALDPAPATKPPSAAKAHEKAPTHSAGA